MELQMSLWDVSQSDFQQYNGCLLHDEAYERLTEDWQRLGSLKTERLSPGVFEDLVFWKCADFLVEVIGSHDEDGKLKPRGCRQWYRKGTGRRESIEVSE